MTRDPLAVLRTGPLSIRPPESFAADLRDRYRAALPETAGRHHHRVARRDDVSASPTTDAAIVDLDAAGRRPERRSKRLMAAALATAATVVVGLIGIRRSAREEPKIRITSTTTIAPPSTTSAAPVTANVAETTTEAGPVLPRAGELADLGATGFDDTELPSFMAIVGDSVWIQHEKGPLVRRNKLTGEVTATVDIKDTGSYFNAPIVAGFGSLWLGRIDGTVLRIDPDTAAVVATITVPDGLYPASEVSDLAIGAGAVWVLSGGNQERRIERIEPGTGTVTSFQAGSEPSRADNIAFVGGELWLLHTAARRIDRFNPVDMTELGSIPLPIAVYYLRTTDGGVWAVSRGVDGIARVDPQTNEVVAAVTVGADPTPHYFFPDVAFGGGFLWEATSPISLITKIDVRTGEVVARYASPGDGDGSSGIAADDAALWFTSRRDKKVYRVLFNG